MKATHTVCRGQVVPVTRTVTSEPADQRWPRNLVIKVPYCLTCRSVVNVDELEVRDA
jgi:hypothetical protein